MIIDEPKNEIINKDDTKAELSLIFEKNAVYFQGHFLEVPILPGVVQTHFAAFYIKKIFNLDPTPRNIKKLRFTNIIHPDVKINLTIEKKDNKIKFIYFDKNKKYSSGEFYLKNV